MHYFVSAGEPSGDLHASALIAALRVIDADARFTFLGGDMMAASAGSPPVLHYSRMAFMGFSEVLRNLKTISANFRIARRALAEARPDALILVDYPSFNLKLARQAKQMGIPVFYYIAPKVWAWKEWRVKSLRRYVDRVLSILPFEEEYFKSKRVNAIYVGNPSREEIDARISCLPSKAEFLAAHSLPPDARLLALVPGSRRGEIKNNLPIMDAVALRHPDLTPVIAGAPGMSLDFYRQFSDLPVIFSATFDLMCHSEAALVTSGTATLEAALATTPQVVCYRANGVKLSYNIMRHLLKIKYVSLPNLIADRPIVPEMLVHLCTVDSVDAQLSAILPGGASRQAQLDGYHRLREILGTDTAASKAAATIYSDIVERTAHQPR